MNDETQLLNYTVPRAWPTGQRAADMISDLDYRTEHTGAHRKGGRTRRCTCWQCRYHLASTAPLYVPAVVDPEGDNMFGFGHRNDLGLDPHKYVDPPDRHPVRAAMVLCAALATAFTIVAAVAALYATGVIR